MDVMVFDKNLEYLANIDSYKSLIWNTRYNSPGEFELYLPMYTEILDILQQDFYLCREKDVFTYEDKIVIKNMMIIEKLNINTDVEEGNYLTVTGRSLQSLVYRRIIWKQTNITGLISTIVYRLLMENVVSPQLASRKLPNFRIDDSYESDSITERQWTGDNLGEVITNLCMEYWVGYDVDCEIFANRKEFVFRLYRGKNRAANQGVLPPIEFKPENENLIETNYSTDKTNYKNVALVAGEGEGTERKTKECGTGEGINRYELFVDARDISTNDGEYTEEEYQNQLTNKGLTELMQTNVKKTFEGSTEDRYYTLGIDYFLGDWVTVENEYKVRANTRVSEVIESIDESGISIIPKFTDMEV